jgi:hypothetical protein
MQQQKFLQQKIFFEFLPVFLSHPATFFSYSFYYFFFVLLLTSFFFCTQDDDEKWIEKLKQLQFENEPGISSSLEDVRKFKFFKNFQENFST